jgi:hypothetical protein
LSMPGAPALGLDVLTVRGAGAQDKRVHTPYVRRCGGAARVGCMPRVSQGRRARARFRRAYSSAPCGDGGSRWRCRLPASAPCRWRLLLSGLPICFLAPLPMLSHAAANARCQTLGPFNFRARPLVRCRALLLAGPRFTLLPAAGEPGASSRASPRPQRQFNLAPSTSIRSCSLLALVESKEHSPSCVAFLRGHYSLEILDPPVTP